MHKKILSGFGFFSGISYPLRAIKLIFSHKKLWQYLVIPILINLIIGITTYILLLRPSLDIFNNFSQNLLLDVENSINNLADYLSFLFYLTAFFVACLQVILLILLLIIVGFIITQFGSILGAPWYGKLSEQIEIIKTGKLEIIEINILHDLWRAILFEFKKIGLIIVVGIPLLLLNFIPGFGNLIATIGGITLTAVIVCLDFFDASLERRRLKFRQKLQFVAKGLPTTAGFGLVCLALVSIPLLNLISVPLCVSAGTLLVCDSFIIAKDKGQGAKGKG